VWGAIGGILLGAAAAALVVVTFGTGLVVIAAAAAAAGLIGGIAAATGAALGQYGDNKGVIAEGSANVFFEGQPVARVGDKIQCSDHPSSPPPMIAEGAKTVFANQKQIARLGHRTTCDGNINAGCGSLAITQETAYVYEVADSRNPYLRWSAVILSFLPIQKKFEQGFRSLKKPPNTAVNATHNCPTGSDPVDMVSGDYLQVWPVIDIAGVLPVRLQRTYRSGDYFTVSGCFGHKWADSWSQHLVVHEDNIDYIDEEGGGLSFFTPENKVQAVNLYNLRYELVGERHGELRVFDRSTQQTLHFNQQQQQQRYLSAITDRKGNRIDFRYQQGELISVEHSDGYVLEIDSRGRTIHAVELVTQEKRQKLLQSTFSERGYLVQCQSFQYGTLSHEYDPKGYMVRWRDTDSTDVAVRYDISGRVVALKTSTGFFADHFIYHDKERYTIYRDGEGGETGYHYNENNLLIKLVDPLGNITLTDWDLTQKIKETDALGRITRFIYNERGDLTAVIHPDETRTEYEYNPSGVVTAFTSSAGDSWQYQYDRQGLLRQVTYPSGQTMSFRYGKKGEVLRKIIAEDQVWRYHYDHHGCLSTIIDPKGNSTAVTLDVLGRLFSHQNALGELTRYTHSDAHASPAGSVTKMVMPDGVEQAIAYDSEKRIAGLTDGAGKTTRYEYGGFDLLTGLIRPDGQRLTFGYDTLTRLNQVTNASGDTYRYTRDRAGQVISETDFTGRTVHYQYDAVGRRIGARYPDQRLVRWHYSMQDQVLAQQTWHCDALSSTLVGTVSYGYDRAGRLLSATNADAVVEFDYDEAGQLVAERLNGREVRHQWDALNGTPVARQVGELGLTFVYGAQGELTRLQLAGHQPLALQHDRLGRETVRESAAGFIQACNYTPSGLLAHQAAGRNSALFQQQLIAPESPALHGSAVNRSWQYDRAYNVVGMDDGRWGKTQYQYDRNDQVVRADFGGFLPLQEQFSYDVNQNLREHRCLPRGAQAVLAQASQQQQAGRVVKRGDSQYRYDAGGRLVEKRSQKDGYRPQLWRYRWNEQDQLSELITPTGARWRYGYDAFGRRIRKLRVVDTPPLNEMDAPSTGPATASLAGYAYLWSGDQLIEEVPVYADGTVAYEQGIHWLYAPGGLTPMARYAQGKLHYVVADHLGTPRELLNEQGKVVWASRLSTWGQAELWRQAANEEDRVSCNLRFAGQYADAESGLHYNRFRYYDGETGQYLCPDPIGLEGGLNPYGYVHNPVSWVDPLGLATCPPHPYQGVRDASEYLRSQNVPRDFRKQIIQSFDIETIKVRPATSNEYGLRYFDNVNALEKGRYIFETFPATRSSLAVKTEWNQMTYFSQFKVTPGVTIIEGKAAAQGVGLPGGQIQKYISNLDKLTKQ
ncbi:hypothetical protein B7R70_17440, partial [Yersinia pseudotuberculosis]